MISAIMLCGWDNSETLEIGAMGVQVTSAEQLPNLLRDHLARLGRCRLRLYANDLQPVPSTETEDFVELVAAGYAPIPLNSWGRPYLGEGQIGSVDHPLVDFAVGPDAGGESAYGYYLTDAGGYWLAASKFVRPVNLAAIRTITLGVRLRLSQSFVV